MLAERNPAVNRYVSFDGIDRAPEEIARGITINIAHVEYDGLEIIPPYPGAPAEVAFVGLWGAEDADLADDDSSRLAYAAVARKP